jgi:hypothetical protein
MKLRVYTFTFIIRIYLGCECVDPELFGALGM